MSNASVRSMVLIVPALILLPSAGHADGTFGNWSANAAEELEFGVTALVGAVSEDSPWVFEGGYNGAYWFDNAYSVGQTFTVPSDRTLQSVSARISAGRDTTGRFEVAIYVFDPDTLSTTTRLAFATGDAADYGYDLQGVPVSTFDVSGAGATLTAGQTYMLTFRGLEGSAGTFYVQGGTNIYGGGSVHQAQYVPSGPDLTGAWTPKRDGRWITGTLRAENTGNEPAGSAYAIGVYRSADGTTPGKRILARTFPKRRKADFMDFSLRFRAPADGYVIAIIDRENRVAETNETNNVVVLHGPDVP